MFKLAFAVIITIGVFTNTANASTIDYSKFAGKYAESVFNKTYFVDIFKNAIADKEKYNKFRNGFNVSLPMEGNIKTLVGVGCVPHDCADSGSIFMFAEGHIYIAIKENGVFIPLTPMPKNISKTLEEKISN